MPNTPPAPVHSELPVPPCVLAALCVRPGAVNCDLCPPLCFACALPAPLGACPDPRPLGDGLNESVPLKT